MASGKLGAAAPPATTVATLYTVPANTAATINVLAVNRGDDTATVRVALTTAEAPAAPDWIEYDAVLPGKGSVLERFGVVAGAGEKVVVWASNANVTFRVNGFEGAAS